MATTLLNRLISALSPSASRLLSAHCTPVALPTRFSLYQPEELPKYCFFLTSGIASVVTPMVDGWSAEAELLGNEGLVGSLHLLGPAPIHTSCFMQTPGTGQRIELRELRKLFLTSEEIHSRILELVQMQALSISQIAACNRLHPAEARLARWLLMMQDRTGSEDIRVTQAFLGEMLGTRRTTVTAIAGALQRNGLIRYQQGKVCILHRLALQAAACDCYRVVERLRAGLYSLPYRIETSSDAR